MRRYLFAACSVGLLLGCDDPQTSGAADSGPAADTSGGSDGAEDGAPADFNGQDNADSTPSVEDTADTGDSAAPDSAEPDTAEPVGLAVLGAGSHTPAGLVVETLLDSSSGLHVPRDLAFNPNVRDGVSQLWVADADMRMFILSNPGTPNERLRAVRSAGSDHFMPAPVSLAFSDTGYLATVHETDWVTQPSTPWDFMGPTLWPADSSEFDGGWGSHLDMLHNSPNAVGIAWDHDNAYWVFDGAHRSITYYDFHEDHGPGGEDHSDGTIVRWVEGEVGYLPGVTSDLAFDRATSTLYIADSGNARVAVLDTSSGSRGRNIGPDYDGVVMYAQSEPLLITLVDFAALGAPEPTGLTLHDGKLWVSERTSAKVFAFDPAGTLIDWIDLSSLVPAGDLGAITLDDEGRLLVIDVGGARVLRLAAP